MQKVDEPKIYKASKILQSKVGTGLVSKEKIETCQQTITENTTDFEPMAKEFLNKLAEAINAAKGPQSDLQELRQSVTEPVMQLKANASMFGYTLIGEMANILLSFLESVSSIDKDMISIVEASHSTLTAVVKNKLKGDGGTGGRAMKEELMGACKRYMNKRFKK